MRLVLLPCRAAWFAAWQVTAEFNQINGLVLVCRAHQLVQEGLKYMFQGAPAGSRATPCAPSHCQHVASAFLWHAGFCGLATACCEGLMKVFGLCRLCIVFCLRACLHIYIPGQNKAMKLLAMRAVQIGPW